MFMRDRDLRHRLASLSSFPKILGTGGARADGDITSDRGLTHQPWISRRAGSSPPAVVNAVRVETRPYRSR